MKNTITLTHTKVQGKRVEYIYEVQGEWAACFNTEETFFVEYPFNIERITAEILVIPFLGNIMPAAWLYDAVVTVPVCDEDYYYCLSKVREGFEQMYPYLRWNGELIAEKIHKNRKKTSGGAMLLFSGGVDAYTSLIRHKAELPDLCMIWGSDVPLTEHKGWTLLSRKAERSASEFDCSVIPVRTSFRSVLRTGRLGQKIKESGDSYWHGFQHGLALLSLAAPASWQKGRETVYMASSFTREDHAACASDPRIDDQVRFCGAKCVHDGYALNRQEKIRLITDFCDRTHVKIKPHVCWKSTDGLNCGHCEKCYRTMLGLLAERKDPREFGFPGRRETGSECTGDLAAGACRKESPLYGYMSELGEQILQNRELLEKNFRSRYSPIMEAFRKNYAPEEVPSSLSWLLTGEMPESAGEQAGEDTGSSPENVSGKSQEEQKIDDDQVTSVQEGNAEALVNSGREYPARCFMLGVPDHSNLGDHQIAESICEFLHDIAPDMAIQEVSLTGYAAQKENLKKLIRKNDVLILLGGGFFGNLWPRGDVLRRDVFATWPGNPKIMFPQSVCFTEDEEGQRLLEECRTVYGDDHAILSFRDTASYQIIENAFSGKSGQEGFLNGEEAPDAEAPVVMPRLFLTPDIVAWSDRRAYGTDRERCGALLILRSDQERALSDEDKKDLKQILRQQGYAVKEDDMVQKPQASSASRAVRLDTMLQKIAGSEVVVTDRLHAMILSALTGTPCVVLGNSYHKIRSFMSWMEEIPYIRYIEEPEKCGEALKEVTGVKDPVYPLDTMRGKFADFREAVQDVLREAAQKQTSLAANEAETADFRKQAIKQSWKKNQKKSRGRASKGKKSPLVSIIIPVYNVEKYLHHCLDSVLSQTLTDMEILCVNDGSADSSPQILAEYQKKDRHIRILNQENAGLSAARNNGLSNAIGKYIYYLDSDDYLEPDALEKMVQRMEAEQLDFVLFNAVPFTREGTDADIEDFRYRYTRTFAYPDLYTGGMLLSKLFEHNEYQPMAWSYMTSRELILRHKLHFLEGILHEDNLYTFQCYLNAERAGYLPDVLYHRRVAGGSIMTSAVTFENVRGYFLSYLEMNINIHQKKELNEAEQEAAALAAKRALHNARVQYNKLTEEEKEKYKEFPPQTQMLFRSLILDSVEVTEAQQDEKLRTELQKAYDDKEERGKEVLTLRKEVDTLEANVKKWKASSLEHQASLVSAKENLERTKKSLKDTEEKLKKSNNDAANYKATLKKVRWNYIYRVLYKLHLVPRFKY